MTRCWWKGNQAYVAIRDFNVFIEGRGVACQLCDLHPVSRFTTLAYPDICVWTSPCLALRSVGRHPGFADTVHLPPMPGWNAIAPFEAR